jgi:hypothetical protein
MPLGERSGSVASSVSRLYIRMFDWPPMRRCFFVPRVEDGMVMKVMCEAVRGLDAFLFIYFFSVNHVEDWLFWSALVIYTFVFCSLRNWPTYRYVRT